MRSGAVDGVIVQNLGLRTHQSGVRGVVHCMRCAHKAYSINERSHTVQNLHPCAQSKAVVAIVSWEAEARADERLQHRSIWSRASGKEAQFDFPPTDLLYSNHRCWALYIDQITRFNLIYQ